MHGSRLAWQVQLYYILAELVSVYKAWYPGRGSIEEPPNLNRIQGPTAMPLEPLTKTDISLKFIYITCLRLILLATTHNGKWQTLKSQKFTETFKLVTQIFPTVETPHNCVIRANPCHATHLPPLFAIM